jgi:hypothetical protein
MAAIRSRKYQPKLPVYAKTTQSLAWSYEHAHGVYCSMKLNLPCRIKKRVTTREPQPRFASMPSVNRRRELVTQSLLGMSKAEATLGLIATGFSGVQFDAHTTNLPMFCIFSSLSSQSDPG